MDREKEKKNLIFLMIKVNKKNQARFKQNKK